ncbi:hypothetical protein HDZ31DRAFT_78841, partial [Schizophyllum fasciatum]
PSTYSVDSMALAIRDAADPLELYGNYLCGLRMAEVGEAGARRGESGGACGEGGGEVGAGRRVGEKGRRVGEKGRRVGEAGRGEEGAAAGVSREDGRDLNARMEQERRELVVWREQLYRREQDRRQGQDDRLEQKG